MFDGFVALNKVDILWIPAAGGNDKIMVSGNANFTMLSILGTGLSKMIGSRTRQQITNLSPAVEDAVDGQISRTIGFKFRQIFCQGIFIQNTRLTVC